MAEKDLNLYDVNNGVRGRDGGPYLDDEQKMRAETVRAKVEGREPDYDNPGATAGTQLRIAELVPDNVYANPSMQGAPGPQAILDMHADDKNFLANPVAVVPAAVLETPDQDVDDSLDVEEYENDTPQFGDRTQPVKTEEDKKDIPTPKVATK